MNLPRLILLLALSMAVAGFADEKPSTPPPDAKGDRGPGSGKGMQRPPNREGGRPEWSGKGPGGRPPMPMGGQEFEKLPEEERKRVREALAKAWGHEDVHAARDQVIRANEELRETIRKVLIEIDPHVVEVLEKIRPSDDHKGPGFGQPLDPKSPNFTRQVADRLGRELQAFSRPDRHEETRQFHEKIMTLPPMVDAFERLKKLPPEKREEAVSRIREVYRQVASGEMKKMREKSEAKKDEAEKAESGLEKDAPAKQE